MPAEGPLTPPPGVEVWETRTVQMWVADGCFHIAAKAGSVHGRAEAEENFAVLPDSERGSGRPTLADLRHVRSIDREARVTYRSQENNSAAAVAILVGSPLSRAIGNFFIGLSRLAMPARLFTSEEAARAWLKSFLQSSGQTKP